MTGAEAKDRLLSDPDFVYLKRFDYSLEKALERYPDGLPEKLCAAALMVTEEDWEILWSNLVIKLRSLMGVDLSN